MQAKWLKIIFGALVFGILGASPNVSASNKLQKETTTTVNFLSKVNATTFYRVNKPTKIKVRFSGKSGEQQIVRRITLKRGTVITQGNSFDDTRRNTSPDLSYQAKRKAYTKGAYGPGYLPTNFWNVNPKYMTRIKRPAYLLPNQGNCLLSGGLKAFGNNDYHSNQVKITSDGYVEFYRYHPVSFTEGKKTVTLNYQQKPTAYAKITKTIKSTNKTYLYFKHNLKGVKDKQVHKTGNARYRLTLNNLHTPYSKYDSEIGYRLYASLYTLGGSSYYAISAVN
ncbi:hypothetical protein LASUN_09910 [Lentilactobacillus sunkii]|jgi:hypothetical protein|uniref:Surface layer protein A domain-containing protein n=1 Tax=Lentilactobacillus sunkii TaxID=481719 RepID=A0A1E7XEF8_9LACO|nr:hypothetical protein [Lentilactobacillus sunkii]OFA11382.1 hypothetical protein LASUN_09910 [Lentilactobacillus sunkii]